VIIWGSNPSGRISKLDWKRWFRLDMMFRAKTHEWKKEWQTITEKKNIKYKPGVLRQVEQLGDLSHTYQIIGLRKVL